MASADAPRGADHCHNFHQAVLTKQPAIDLVASLATNPHAFEPTSRRAALSARSAPAGFNGRRGGSIRTRRRPRSAPGDSDAPAGAVGVAPRPPPSPLATTTRRRCRPSPAGGCAPHDGAAAGASVGRGGAAEAARPLVVAAREATDLSRPSPSAAPNTAPRCRRGRRRRGRRCDQQRGGGSGGGSGCGGDGKRRRRGGRRSLCKEHLEAAVPSFGSSAGVDAAGKRARGTRPRRTRRRRRRPRARPPPSGARDAAVATPPRSRCGW